MSEDALAKIKAEIERKRVRVQELFSDFDPLRTGYVSRYQFIRCILQKVGPVASSSEVEDLARHYDARSDGSVFYRSFLDGIDQTVLALQSPRRVLSDEDEQSLQALLPKLKHAYHISGIDVKAFYEKFDPLRSGRVTTSQFLRSFPGPAAVDQRSRELLARKYSHGTGDVDYNKFWADVTDYHVPALRTTATPTASPVATQYSGDVAEILERLKAGFFRSRVRPIDYFADHDPLRSGVVTQNQFTCGLSLACSAHNGAQLSRDETALLMAAFKSGSGIHYINFCRVVDSAFMTGFVEDLERVPTASPQNKSRYDVVPQTPPSLSSEDERLAKLAISVLRDKILVSGADPYSFFQDFNSIYGNSLTVTTNQFERALDALKLKIPSNAIQALSRKFPGHGPNEVDFRSFIAAVDVKAKLQQTDQLYHTLLPQATLHAKKLDEMRSPSRTASPVASNIDSILKKIQQKVLLQRLRINEVYADHDRLRSGFVSRPRFDAGLDLLGLSLAKPEINALAVKYAKPADPALINWKAFQYDVESVESDNAIIYTPTRPTTSLGDTVKQLAMEVKPTAEERGFDGDTLAQIDHVLARIASWIAKQTSNLDQIFRSFDLHNNGHVTQEQFLRTLNIAGLPLAVNEAQLLATYFKASMGVDYREFLQRVVPTIPLEHLYLSLGRTKTPVATSHPTTPSSVDYDQLLQRIITQVVRDRIRVIDFMQDYDRLRSSRVKNENFVRALQASNIALTAAEVDCLTSHYAAHGYPGFVDYVRFSDDVEESFTTKNLEKDPLRTPVPFVPPSTLQIAASMRPTELEKAGEQVLRAIARLVASHRILIKPSFKNYDKHHMGTVTKTQFRRVFTDLGLGNGLSEVEITNLMSKYTAPLGGRDDIYYGRFCQDIDHIVTVTGPMFS